jgi:hypothetical protein
VLGDSTEPRALEPDVREQAIIEMFNSVKLPSSPGSRWRSAIGAGDAIDAIVFADDDTAALGEKSCRIGWSMHPVKTADGHIRWP